MNEASYPAPPPLGDLAVEQVLQAWAMDELATWRLNPVSRDAAMARFRLLNETSRTVYVYEIDGQSVGLLEKPERVEQHPGGTRRSLAYLRFFQSVCPFLPEDFRATIALDTWDKVVVPHDVPVFCFQKRRGETSVLLPDIDFLNNDFYPATRFDDRLAYSAKMAKAIFVGSTSGGSITPDIARTCSLPRLRAAKFFQDNARVEFLLPQIVQTTSNEAADILRGKPFCQTAFIPWHEQLLRRFVISMDGNGATCSRVAIALLSNSVLLKYHSDDVLYYFRHMQPWLHYVPVAKDSDVERILDMAADAPAIFQAIAARSRVFAETYLSHTSVLAYTAHLFRLYAECFADGSATGHRVPEAADPTAASRVAQPKYVLFNGHVQGKGDVAAGADGWLGEAGSGRAVEGFSFSLGDAKLNRQFFYRSVRADGALDTSVNAGAFCGTRGKAQPLHGFVVEYAETAADMPALGYEGVFRDGSASGELLPGTICRSATGAPLVAMRIYVVRL